MLIRFTAPIRTWHASYMGHPHQHKILRGHCGEWSTWTDGCCVMISRPTLPALRRRMAEIRWRARVGLPPFG